jgi:hypothetical protein
MERMWGGKTSIALAKFTGGRSMWWRVLHVPTRRHGGRYDKDAKRPPMRRCKFIVEKRPSPCLREEKLLDNEENTGTVSNEEKVGNAIRLCEKWKANLLSA